MQPIIKVENLSKRYTIHHQPPERYTALRDVISSTIRGWLSPSVSRPKPDEQFYALQDISFNVFPGDRLGIIGKNGAGKSTLLKILSRITEPTHGSIRINGRIASLLEVGTGFHPELTGRENIYLNGAILGMSHREIKQKFDAIVDFAEIERFLDTPVKHYSSGMYVRLAFAVAANLNPDILIVDEVLAVGDLKFQRKCLGRMEELSHDGRTLILVSHNMNAILNLCNKGILIDAGKIIQSGDTQHVVEGYLQAKEDNNSIEKLRSELRNLPPDPTFSPLNISLTQDGHPIGEFIESGKPLLISVQYRIMQKVRGMRIYVDLLDAQDTLILRSFHDELEDGIPEMEKGTYLSRLEIPANILGPTSYELRFNAGIFNIRDCIPPRSLGLKLSVIHTGIYNRAYLEDTFRGMLAMPLNWSTVMESPS